jgi:hypothetical protein
MTFLNWRFDARPAAQDRTKTQQLPNLAQSDLPIYPGVRNERSKTQSMGSFSLREWKHYVTLALLARQQIECKVL